MSPLPPRHLSFTVSYPGRVNQLRVEIFISKPIAPGPGEVSLENEKAKKYICIWDTGATGSVISHTFRIKS
jgi:hypothetical protein